LHKKFRDEERAECPFVDLPSKQHGQWVLGITPSMMKKINWINYRTGAKDVYFRMEADKTHASISIELSHADPHTQASYFERLQKLKGIVTETMNEQWTWERLVPDEHGKLVSRIYIEMKNVSIMNQSDWPALISFFKKRMMAFRLGLIFCI